MRSAQGPNVEWIQLPDIENVVGVVQRRIAPQVGFWFIALVVALSLFHESNPYIVGGIVFFWFFVMGLKEKADLRSWRPPIALSAKWILYFAVYLAIGFGWSFPKLFIHIWRGKLDDVWAAKLTECLEAAIDSRAQCFVDVTYGIQPTIFKWILYWPLSIVNTIVQHPIRIALDLGYHFFEGVYGRVAEVGAEWLAESISRHSALK